MTDTEIEILIALLMRLNQKQAAIIVAQLIWRIADQTFKE